MKVVFTFIFLAGMLCSCATVPDKSVNCDINDETGLPVLRPAAFGKKINVSQLVKIESKNGKFEFISQLELDSSRLVLVAMTKLGQKLFQVVYQKGEIDFQSWGVSLEFDIAYLLTDISFIYAPHANLLECFMNQPTGLSVTEDHEKRIRRISGTDYSGTDYAGTVKYSSSSPWRGNITYVNAMLDYKIDITILGADTL